MINNKEICNKSLKAQYKKYSLRKASFIILLIPVLIILVGAAVSIGSADVSWRQTYTVILERFFPDSFQSSRLTWVVVWKLRLPRVLMGLLSGFGLGVAGGVMQGVLRNPLAEPYMLGIASSAGFGASLAILLGIGIIGGQYLVITNAFIFALLCSAVIIAISSRKGARPEAIVIIGISMNFLFQAMNTFMLYFADPDAVKAAMFWMIGDLGRVTWSNLKLVTPVIIACLILLLWKSKDLNIVNAGDDSAKSLGIRVLRLRIFLMIIVSLLVSAIVCFTGAIGFVGLVAPHICRIVIGGNNKYLLPASGLLGAVLLIVADTVARTIMSPVILPVGVITTFLGVPLLIYLIMQKKGDVW
jgi:iron complex transport system permease protein